MGVANGVIAKATGDLLRFGTGVQFASDPAFDAESEETRQDVPVPSKRIGDPGYSTFHRWTGGAWQEIVKT